MGLSRSQRSGIWWSPSFEKIGTSETIGCHLGNLTNLTDHCDLFFARSTEPSYQRDSMWALSHNRLVPKY